MLLKSLLVFLLCLTINASEFLKSVQYLMQYGYLKPNDIINKNLQAISETSRDYIDALKRFQEYYNLTVDGTLNAETLDLMGKPRCGVTDEIPSELNRTKWINKTITWYLNESGNMQQKNIINEAFKVWSTYTDFNFVETNINPNIMITIRSGTNFPSRYPVYCSNLFSQQGEEVVAHATPPKIEYINGEKISKVNIKICAPEETNFIEMAVHEIGHALGMHHSPKRNSIMYPYFERKVFVRTTLELPEDDIDAIQRLYGKRNSTPDLCNIKDKLNTFLLVEDSLYIFYKDWVWIKDLSRNILDFKPIYLPKLMPFLGQEEMVGLYQRPNNNLMVFVSGDDIYNVTYPSFQKQGKLRFSPDIQRITAVVNSYKGHTYIFYNSDYVSKIDECDFKIMESAFVFDMFPGIPAGVEGAFRYKDGLIYFFKNHYYYAYSEFDNMVVKTGVFSLSLFDIECSNVNIFHDLTDILAKLKQYYPMVMQ